MNNRIKEIEDQCWYQEPCDFDMKADGLSTILTKFDRKKFAELIVEECLNATRGSVTGEDAFNQIKQHFGVK